MHTKHFIEHQHINIYVTYFLLCFIHFIINDYPVVLLLVYIILVESYQCWTLVGDFSVKKKINVTFCRTFLLSKHPVRLSSSMGVN